MKWLLIGHRGTGKTSLLRRLQSYFPQIPCYDLDQEIVKKSGMTISDFFQQQGEVSFRQIERQTLNELIHSNSQYIIACGAGIELEKLKIETEIIWIRRVTDKTGRVFLDRPRLEKQGSALDEYMHRYRERNSLFQKYATEIIDIPEGFDFENEYEKKLLQQNFQLSQWTVTLQVYHFRSPESLSIYLKKRCYFGLQIELRDDLLTKEQIHQALQIIPASQALISFRQKNTSKDLLDYVQKHSLRCDWDLQLGTPAFTPTIVSLHQANTLAEGLEQISQYPQCLQKAALPVNSFSELLQGDAWLLESPQRAFLPCSADGSWRWYRSFRSSHQALQFLADQTHSQVDQPSLLEALRAQSFVAPKTFAAVLGNPIEHSLSPATHFAFFKAQQIPFYAIPIKDWNLEALKKLGLKYAAITSPLKNLAYEACEQTSPEAESLKSVNTLVIDDKTRGFNTDVYGLQKTLQNLSTPIVIWGGGGLLSSIQQVLPQALPYSSRSGIPKQEAPIQKPKTIIWAVGRTAFEEKGTFPPSDWNPDIVMDMNYSEDSYGKIYAQNTSATYISGMTLFLEQAKKQQEIWATYFAK